MSNGLLINDLQEQIDRGQVVAIVGADVSASATNQTPLASWIGLLEDGVNRCCIVAKPLPNGWKERVLGEIHSGDLDDVLSAAEKVSRKLGGPDVGKYSPWLRECGFA
jgi:hypothetical protein